MSPACLQSFKTAWLSTRMKDWARFVADIQARHGQLETHFPGHGVAMSVAQDAETRFLPALHIIAAEINRRFKNVRADIWSGPVGSLTEFQGHGLGVDCLIYDAPADQPDNIALIIGYEYLATSPKVNADVCWGHPSGHVEADVFATPLELNEAALAGIEAALPRLSAALIAALEQGHPPAEGWDRR
jgi:hypothetical protein